METQSRVLVEIRDVLMGGEGGDQSVGSQALEAIRGVAAAVKQQGDLLVSIDRRLTAMEQRREASGKQQGADALLKVAEAEIGEGKSAAKAGGRGVGGGGGGGGEGGGEGGRERVREGEQEIS